MWLRKNLWNPGNQFLIFLHIDNHHRHFKNQKRNTAERSYILLKVSWNQLYGLSFGVFLIGFPKLIGVRDLAIRLNGMWLRLISIWALFWFQLWENYQFYSKIRMVKGSKIATIWPWSIHRRDHILAIWNEFLLETRPFWSWNQSSNQAFKAFKILTAHKYTP